MFVHYLPTTRAISYADYFHTSKWSVEISQATEKRSKLQQVLEDVIVERGSTSTPLDGSSLFTHKEWIKVVQSVDDYLPYLYSICDCIKSDDILFKGELFFTWKDTLLASTSKNILPGIHYEMISVLLVQAKSLCNFAASLVDSLGQYEVMEAATLSDEDRKRKEDRLKFAADLQCRAAGIFEYIARQLVPEWENTEGTSRLSDLGRSIESTGEFCFALSKLAHAESELLAIRKLLSPSQCYQTANKISSPPLSASHPSPSLLSKLFLNVTDTYELVFSLSQIASSKSGLPIDGSNKLNSTSGGKEGISGRSFGSAMKQKWNPKFSSNITPRLDQNNVNGKASSNFMKYLAKSVRNNRARAYFWLGIDRGERGQYGDALAFFQMATNELNTKFGGKSGSTFRKDVKTKEDQKDFARDKDELLNIIEHFSTSYKQLNDSVAFQTVSSTSSLTSQIPAGRAATTIKTFSPPAAIFGGTKSMASLAEAFDPSLEESDTPADRAEKIGSSDYVGKGAYY